MYYFILARIFDIFIKKWPTCWVNLHSYCTSITSIKANYYINIFLTNSYHIDTVIVSIMLTCWVNSSATILLGLDNIPLSQSCSGD